jgi:TRAP-type C4-dicarboxylate transport system substrate-binding protein
VPVRTAEDVKGKRLRFASPTIREFITALGGTPVGLPPTDIVEAMQRGTIDGAVIDYGGAGIAFKMGPVTKYVTEMYSYVTSFCICMNPDSYKKLPPNLQKLITDSFAGVEKAVGHEWDKLDDIGKGVMMKDGMQPVVLSEAEDKKFRAVGATVSEPVLADLEKKGLPAREVYKMMQALAAKHTPGSRNFWKR